MNAIYAKYTNDDRTALNVLSESWRAATFSFNLRVLHCIVCIDESLFISACYCQFPIIKVLGILVEDNVKVKAKVTAVCLDAPWSRKRTSHRGHITVVVVVSLFTVCLQKVSPSILNLFISHHSVWSGISAHNLTPLKRELRQRLVSKQGHEISTFSSFNMV